MPLLEIIGWTGSVLVVVSLMQARVLRFRVLNLVGSLIATGYNLWADIWPFAAMNGVIAIIDLYWIWRLLRERHDADAYQVIEVGPSEAYLRHVTGVHAEDIARFYPNFAGEADGTWAYLVLRGDETVGVVVLRDAGDGVGEVLLDYVTPRFRDFAPGEFVYRRSGALSATGLRELTVVPRHSDVDPYLSRVGFRRDPDGTWRRPVAR
ncbi:YgjV family protein [Cellulomonas sp. RIT-PI-Y]|jgi:hypothetical protein|uniref:YgjV family protein n=1 Tax=Cellulomonas sp. RIT-PI-Y TaxID=3035297 RepID=UPI0021D81732|nr:YgjV family protein [Cellulomonas sp. RIT-PI-Y]